MAPVLRAWLPAAVLLLGVAMNGAIGPGQRVMPLRTPLDSAIPAHWLGYRGRDITISAAERSVAGMTSYTMRVFEPVAPASGPPFSVYVGYYSHQARGQAIHSPRNCLPGAGWEPLQFRAETLATSLGPVTVNRYLIRRGQERAVVLYWYQGRGRVASNEFRVKWELLRDRVLLRRSDDTLVRVIIPVSGEESSADRLALQIAGRLLPAVARAVPS